MGKKRTINHCQSPMMSVRWGLWKPALEYAFVCRSDLDRVYLSLVGGSRVLNYTRTRPNVNTNPSVFAEKLAGFRSRRTVLKTSVWCCPNLMNGSQSFRLVLSQFDERFAKR
ncbi:hypothetical protein AVEN_90889-1 [Araneus ventricosus]|uniref:Uncharacterized protein n=1 Tax=Araneus ventricosus TaxID=182803 RepID=A0A4Y2N2I5_ARAVE|nr:hypothetical protein AVEN_90889-1 [Araneus ventricosus]